MSKEYKSKKIQLDEISRTWTESLQSLLKLSPEDFSTNLLSQYTIFDISNNTKP